MKVLSLFDGISVARVALERAGLPVEAYYASEVDKYATAVSEKNYPDIIRLGDVRTVGKVDCDLLIGGSPCQDLSVAKKDRKGLDGERSGLFWEFVRILKGSKPRWFVLENVNSMPKEAKQIITQTLGVEPLMIDAALVSAQSRKRLFWTNLPNITLPADRGILLNDIIHETLNESFELQKYATDGEWLYDTKVRKDRIVRLGHFGNGGQGERIYSTYGKSVTLSAHGGGRGAKTGLYLIGAYDSYVRRLTPAECCRLQSLPHDYTKGVSDAQAYKVCGNAFNADVVAHILSFLPR